MTSRVAIALCLLLSLSGPSLASGPSQSGGEATEQNSTANPAPVDPAAANSKGQDTDDTTEATESDDQEPAPIDVHRHRPGACPEGPPCKGGE
jgi:hypothetical protein